MLAADIRWINMMNKKKLDEYYAKNPHRMPKSGPRYTLLPDPAEPDSYSTSGPRTNPTTSSASAESSAQGAASAATAPVSPRREASKSYRETLTARMHSQALARRSAPRKKRHEVILYIHLSGCGEAVVADECQLSVDAVESRVRYLMRLHGRALFGEPNASKVPAVMLLPENATSYNVIVKGMRVNDSVALLGPQFGDDLEAMADNLQAERPVKLQIRLLWNGEYLPGLDRAALSPSAAVTAKAFELSQANADAVAAAVARIEAAAAEEAAEEAAAEKAAAEKAAAEKAAAVDTAAIDDAAEEAAAARVEAAAKEAAAIDAAAAVDTAAVVSTPDTTSANGDN
jgi:hypothetical protein